MPLHAIQKSVNRLQQLLSRSEAAPVCAERGLMIYESVNDVMQAEAVLKKAGFEAIRVVAPPPRYRTGCDLSLEFPVIEQVSILRELEQAGAAPLECLLIADDAMQPTEICHTKDFGGHVMVRAANMKIVFEKKSLLIVNISGGGCSDVPYLAQEMIGKTLHEAPSPREAGYTLCAYTLALAFEEARRRFT
jgi:hypothetical protein